MRTQVAMSNVFERLRLLKLENRIAVLEEQVLKSSKRLHGTEAQRFLIALYLGQLDKVIQLSITQKQKAVTVSVMLNIDPDNARKFLSEIPKKEKPLLHTESNYSFLVSFFKDNGHKDLEKEADRILISIQNVKDKKQSS